MNIRDNDTQYIPRGIMGSQGKKNEGAASRQCRSTSPTSTSTTSKAPSAAKQKVKLSSRLHCVSWNNNYVYLSLKWLAELQSASHQHRLESLVRDHLTPTCLLSSSAFAMSEKLIPLALLSASVPPITSTYDPSGLARDDRRAIFCCRVPNNV